MLTQRQYDEQIIEAAKSLPMIARALADANTIKCITALYEHGEINESQMDQVLYGILARKEEPEAKAEQPTSRVRYSEEYRRRRANPID